ncbi:MAG: serine/threonine-protein kinase [Acidobacteriota bacterium]
MRQSLAAARNAERLSFYPVMPPDGAMDPERWHRVKAILGPALELPVEDREKFLQRTCPEAPLRDEIRRLLDAYAGHSTFLEEPLALPTGGDTAGTQQPGDRLGDYRILRSLGEGGMGEVYLADQELPIRRRVALKLIRPDLGSRRFEARFEAERQALALMSHPNIAQVYEAGDVQVGQSSRPFFAMEYVDGRPLKAHCDAERLGIEERITLFTAVCRGVQHAHQKGIIHRDLKPSNVLVAVDDGQPVPKIIDFGIAKATGDSTRAAGQTLLTGQGQWMGTPEYMSPEQAGGAASSVDTRSDVYSLGVMLYELLAGVPPFDVRALQEAGLAELLRTLRTTDPPSPSERLRGLGDPARTVARDRRLDVAGLIRRLRGDLDHVVLKAVESEPDLRYASAAELAEDLRRCLHDEPLLAGSPGSLYAVRKWIRRHRLGFTVVGLLLLSLTIGIIGTTHGLVQARRAERVAQEQSVEAQGEARRASREAATTARVTDFLLDIFDASNPALPAKPGLTLREVLDRGAVRVREELVDQPEVQARLMIAIGRTYHSLGQHHVARDLLRESLAINQSQFDDPHLEIARSRLELSTILRRLADHDESRRLIEQALATRKQILGPDHPQVAEALDKLGLLLKSITEVEASREALEEALKIRQQHFAQDPLAVSQTANNLGLLFVEIEDFDRAQPLLRRAAEIIEQNLGPDHPQLSYSLNNLGILESQSGNREAARIFFERALAIDEKAYGPTHLYIAIGRYNLAELALEDGDCGTARAQFGGVREILLQLFDAGHPRIADVTRRLEELPTACPPR